ncbi:MAG: methylated-DNA--[protein]-cysteine S-methyltransferase [Candidatus Paceibacterota bacterium]
MSRIKIIIRPKKDITDISYSFVHTKFGTILIASSEKGVIHAAYADEKKLGLQLLQKKYPVAKLKEKSSGFQIAVLRTIEGTSATKDKVVLDLSGTLFQTKVWKALLNIKPGKTTTYAEISKKIGLPGANRAVGSAVGANPVAYLIPCHRVVRSDGALGGYHWGLDRKKKMLEWEKTR